MSMDSFGCWLCTGCTVPHGGASETWSTSPERCAVPTAEWPLPSEADWVGDGGGIGDAERAELGDVIESSVGDIGGCTDDPDIARLVLDAPDRALVVDLIDAASDLSPLPETVLSAPAIADVDALGLSFFPLPGILDLMAPLKEREDSLVSDLLNDG